MKSITQSPTDNRQKIRIASAKDFDVSYFCGSGAGGQARNKVASGVQIIHRETGALGRASDSRSQADNKKSAFARLLATPKMKFWLAAQVFQVRQGESLEQSIERDTLPGNLKFEIKNSMGQWIEVPVEYFDLAQARDEVEI